MVGGRDYITPQKARTIPGISERYTVYYLLGCPAGSDRFTIVIVSWVKFPLLMGHMGHIQPTTFYRG